MPKICLKSLSFSHSGLNLVNILCIHLFLENGHNLASNYPINEFYTFPFLDLRGL